MEQQATSFDLEYDSYFEERTSNKWKSNRKAKIKVMALWKRQLGCCLTCLEKVTKQSSWIVHCHKSNLEGGQDNLDNLLLTPNAISRKGQNSLCTIYRLDS